MASLCTDILIESDNKPGVLAKITGVIKKAKINTRALCAWAEGKKGRCMLVTEDNEKALKALKKAGFRCLTSEVLLVELINEIGTLNDVTKKLGDAKININYCYISATGPQCLLVIGTDDNGRAIEVL